MTGFVPRSTVPSPAGTTYSPCSNLENKMSTPTTDEAVRNHERVMAAVSALAGTPYMPENDDMAELLAARLGALK